MFLAIIFLGIASLVDLAYVFNSWVKPRMVQHFQFEPGCDDEVSWKEMWRRNAWRYDSWAMRIISVLGFILLSIAWFLTIKG